MDKASVSVVIIAKNEEKRIEDCVKSVSDWADQVLVIDDKSIDNTKHIAESFGAKVLVKEMINEGEHRNWAKNQAKHDWVLSLDCDERPTPELKEEIKEAIQDDSYQGFSIPFKNYIGDYWIRGGGWYPAPKLRLFKKDYFRYKEQNVHPPIEFKGRCGKLKSDIIHFNYKDWTDYVKKTNNQTILEAKKWYDYSFENPKKARYKMNTIHALWRVYDRFMGSFFWKKGWKDGFIGFMIAYLSAFYQILSYAKYREFKKNDKKQSFQKNHNP